MDLWMNNMKEKVKNTMKSWETSNQIHNISPFLQHENMKESILKISKQNFVFSALIKHQTTFILLVINSKFLS